MFIFYFLILLMLAMAIGLIAFSFKKSNISIFSLKFLSIVLFFIIFSLGFYQWYGNTSSLNQWLTHGEKHYQLMVQFNELGGLDGMIDKVKKKLEINPNDSEGWIVLAKLYHMKHDEDNAMIAIRKAKAGL